MAPTLFHVPKTISSPLVQCLLELGIVNNPVKIEEISFADLKKPEYLAVNPMGTSPAFQDGDVILWESGGILSYLLERYDTEHKLHPRALSKDSTAEHIAVRSKFLQLQQFIIATFYPFMASLYIHTFKPEAEQDKAYIASAKKKFATGFAPVLVKWLGDGPYFFGDEVSAVDVLVTKPLNNTNAMGLLADFPTLLALFERMKARPTFEAAYEGLPSHAKDGEPLRTMVLVPSPQ